MRLLKVNLLAENKTVRPASKTGHSPVKFFISPLTVVLLFVASFALGRISLSETASFALAELDNIPIIGQMRHLISSPDRKLVGEDGDRINILLIGMGGEGHDGPNLTDTLMVASVRPSDGSVALLSVPRDLLVPVPDMGWRKINAVNAYGEMRAPGRGGELTRETIEGLLGISIPYYVRIDFSGFKSIIDSVGGVELYVERSFTDHTYPTYDHGIQAVSFEEGWQHMDGETALRYARSRHGTNGEGSDFARSRRQQKVIAALKEKALSYKTFRNPVTVTNTLAALQANIATDLHLGEILRLARMASDDGGLQISHEVLENGPNGQLVDSIVGGAYVLLPKGGDWNLIRDVGQNIFSVAEPSDAEPPPPSEQLAAEKASVEIQNGNGVGGSARQMAELLSGLGFNVVKIGNADTFSYADTMLFDLTDGEKPASFATLSRELAVDGAGDAKDARGHFPADSADFLVIIGRE